MGEKDRRIEILARLFKTLPREEIKAEVEKMDRQLAERWQKPAIVRELIGDTVKCLN